jgi:hypothetical protein
MIMCFSLSGLTGTDYISDFKKDSFGSCSDLSLHGIKTSDDDILNMQLQLPKNTSNTTQSVRITLNSNLK